MGQHFRRPANHRGVPRQGARFGSVADIPPIHATWTGLDVKIVGAKFRLDPVGHPIYVSPPRPARASRTGRPQGQEDRLQPRPGAGRAGAAPAEEAEPERNEVELVELPSVGDAYVNALASRLVDAAPIAEANKQRFAQNYERDGARLLAHGLRDDPAYLYVVKASLQDPNKAAAIRAYVAAWGRAAKWIETHPDEWVRAITSRIRA